MVIHVDRLGLVHVDVVVHEVIVAHFIYLLELEVRNRWGRKELGPAILFDTGCCFLFSSLILGVYPRTSKMGWRASGAPWRCCWWSNGAACHRGRLSSSHCELHATSLRGLGGLNCKSINFTGTFSVALSKTSSTGCFMSQSRHSSCCEVSDPQSSSRRDISGLPNVLSSGHCEVPCLLGRVERSSNYVVCKLDM